MRIFHLFSIAIASICACFCGCKSPITTDSGNTKAITTQVVVVGMERSQFAGSCPGARYDSDRMYRLLKKYAADSVLLQDSNATKANVTTAFKRAIAKAGNGMVIFYYSGHGGSEPFPDTGIEEADGKDEFLCLYDTYLCDNDIWNMIKESKGRVFWITDSCHSETQFRTPGFVLNPPLSFDHKLNEEHGFSLLCWSGCPDKDYSYGASTGGQFTNALLRHFKDTKTYQALWDEIKTDKTLRAYENPQSTVIGDGFDNKEIFR